MKKRLMSLTAVIMLCFGFSAAQAQSCTMDVVYNANLATEADYLANPALLTGCIESYLLTNSSLTTTVTFVGVTGGTNPVVTLSYTLPTTADSATILTATTGGAVPFGFGTINCLSPNAIDGFGFTAQIASHTVNCGPPTSVPTMSQWGLIIFGLFVLCIGALALFRRSYPREFAAMA